jgi:DNA-binding transcriptional LysR family regulator
MTISLKQMRYIVATAEHQNVTAAAEVLHITQPAISAAISQAESHYDTEIFSRQHGRGVTLTRFGKKFVERAKLILAESASIETLREEQDSVAGEVVIGCFEDLAPYFLPSLLMHFRSLYPDIQVRFREQGFEELARLQEDGILDFTLTYDIALTNALEQAMLMELKAYAMLPPDNPLVEKSTISLEDLAAYPLVLTSQASSWSHVEDIFNNRAVRIQSILHPQSFETQRGYVAKGFGVALVYTRPDHNLTYDGSEVVCREISDELPTQRILLAYAKHHRVSRAARALLDCTREWFSQNAENISW